MLLLVESSDSFPSTVVLFAAHHGGGAIEKDKRRIQREWRRWRRGKDREGEAGHGSRVVPRLLDSNSIHSLSLTAAVTSN